jgi:hypothetical protein
MFDGSLVLMKLTSVGRDSNNMALKVIKRLNERKGAAKQ